MPRNLVGLGVPVIGMVPATGRYTAWFGNSTPVFSTMVFGGIASVPQTGVCEIWNTAMRNRKRNGNNAQEIKKEVLL